ncbi:Phosphate transporter (modular protein) [Burkholderia sp. IT-111MI5]
MSDALPKRLKYSAPEPSVTSCSPGTVCSSDTRSADSSCDARSNSSGLDRCVMSPVWMVSAGIAGIPLTSSIVCRSVADTSGLASLLKPMCVSLICTNSGRPASAGRASPVCASARSNGVRMPPDSVNSVPRPPKAMHCRALRRDGRVGFDEDMGASQSYDETGRPGRPGINRRLRVPYRCGDGFIPEMCEFGHRCRRTRKAAVGMPNDDLLMSCNRYVTFASWPPDSLRHRVTYPEPLHAESRGNGNQRRGQPPHAHPQLRAVFPDHCLRHHLAVVWSGLWNLFGVLVSSGAVAFGIVQLLPVELILQVGSGAGRRNARPAAGPIEFQSDTRRYRWISGSSIRIAPRTPRRGACSPTAGMPLRFR